MPAKRTSRSHATDREDHLPVDVVLDVLVGLVANAHRLLTAEALEVTKLLLDELGLAIDPVERLQNVALPLADAA